MVARCREAPSRIASARGRGMFFMTGTFDVRHLIAADILLFFRGTSRTMRIKLPIFLGSKANKGKDASET